MMYLVLLGSTIMQWLLMSLHVQSEGILRTDLWPSLSTLMDISLQLVWRFLSYLERVLLSRHSPWTYTAVSAAGNMDTI